MSAAVDLTLDALHTHGVEALPLFAGCLRRVCDEAPPPFGMQWYGEKFRSLAIDPNWLAGSLVQNAQVEGDGSRKLWSLAGRAPDAVIASQVKCHAIDESRHALLYLAMLRRSFPEAVDAELEPMLETISPHLTARQVPPDLPHSSPESVLDELIQMNIGEIRTRIHQLLLRPVLSAHTAPENRPAVKSILDSLLLDETRHVAYTARLIEAAMTQGQADYVYSVMSRRVRDFNEITLQEVGSEQFAGE